LARMTSTERRFQSILKAMNVRSYPQSIFFLDNEHYRIVDFYLPRPYRICIELDGSSHDDANTKSYDRWKDRRLITMHRRFRIIRFRNDEVWQTGFKGQLNQVLSRYYIKPHHRKSVRPKWRRDKPNTKPLTSKQERSTKVINAGWSLVQQSWAADKRRGRHYQGLAMQPGYSLAELRKMGIL
jgi:very-short-patch-repair endonuclease